MRDFDLRALQLVELQMLKDFDKFCRENGIDYYLSDGTLLGAVRHQGFIPWDDDIDVCMDVYNYRKFIRIAQKKFPEQYFFQNYRTDHKVGVKWSRVRKNGTTSMERNMTHYDIHYGVCMDIFVMAGIPKTKFGKKIQREASHWLATFLEKYGNEAAGYEVSRKLQILYKYMPDQMRLFICRILERLVLFDTRKKEFCYNTAYLDVEEGVIMPSSFFDSNKKGKLKFEDTEFDVPDGVEQYLELAYGEWKKIPPKEERGGHGDIIVDLNNDYSLYFVGKDKDRN